MEADVQESERLNKTLSLYGDRCPNGNLDLGSSRAGIKHYLGLSGYGAGGVRRFRDVKPTAARLLRECLGAWALLSDVEAGESRFGCAHRRDNVPSLADAKKADSHVNPELHSMTPSKLWAVSMNSQLGAYRSRKTYHTRNGLAALAFVMSPKTMNDAFHIFIVTDKVRTTIHLAGCSKVANSNRYALRTPLCIMKSHDVFKRFYLWVCKEKTAIDVYEILVHAHEASQPNFVRQHFFFMTWVSKSIL